MWPCAKLDDKDLQTHKEWTEEGHSVMAVIGMVRTGCTQQGAKQKMQRVQQWGESPNKNWNESWTETYKASWFHFSSICFCDLQYIKKIEGKKPMDQGGFFNQQSKTQGYSIYSYIKKNPQICKYLAFLISHANSVLTGMVMFGLAWNILTTITDTRMNCNNFMFHPALSSRQNFVYCLMPLSLSYALCLMLISKC